MAVEKLIYVEDLTENEAVETLFLLKDIRLAETRTGKPFLTLILMDKTGEITGRVWDGAEQTAASLKNGIFVTLRGQTQSYKGVLQLRVDAVAPLQSNAVDISQFLPSTSQDIGEMAAELAAIFKGITDKPLRQLLLAVINDKELWSLFQKAPAAKMMHHAYIGGLLEHTLSICRLADKVCLLYPSINKAILLAGILFHDIGKVKEFSFDVPPFDYTDQGRLVGHMVISIEMLQDKLKSLADFPENTAMMIKHLILSHHGRHEFGSPTLPMTREAFVLNLLDDLDAKMNYLDRLSSQTTDNEYQWSEYQRNLERFLFINPSVPGHDHADHAARPTKRSVVDDDIEEDPKQPTLWR